MKIEEAAERLCTHVNVIALFAKYRRLVWYRDNITNEIYIDEGDIQYFEKYIAEYGNLPSIQWQDNIEIDLIFS